MWGWGSEGGDREEGEEEEVEVEEGREEEWRVGYQRVWGWRGLVGGLFFFEGRGEGEVLRVGGGWGVR